MRRGIILIEISIFQTVEIKGRGFLYHELILTRKNCAYSNAHTRCVCRILLSISNFQDIRIYSLCAFV